MGTGVLMPATLGFALWMNLMENSKVRTGIAWNPIYTVFYIFWEFFGLVENFNQSKRVSETSMKPYWYSRTIHFPCIWACALILAKLFHCPCSWAKILVIFISRKGRGDMRGLSKPGVLFDGRLPQTSRKIHLLKILHLFKNTNLQFQLLGNMILNTI